MVIRFSSSFCLFVYFALWLQVYIHEGSCFVGAWFVVFLLVKSNVYLHCCLFFYGVSLLDLVMARRCGSLDYRGKDWYYGVGDFCKSKLSVLLSF